MIGGIGVDLADVARTGSLIERFGRRFTCRVFTDGEIGYCERRKDPASSFAARFAAKEAMMKALGKGWGSGIRFKEIEVEAGERPSLKLHGGARAEAYRQGVERIHVSMSHERQTAMAQVVTEIFRPENENGMDIR
jgi:holo-[acyl-carrier protein] synthase